MKYPDQFRDMFKFQIPYFSRNRTEIESPTPPITLGFPTFGTGELNIDHMGQQSIVPTENFTDALLPVIKALQPVEILRAEPVAYFGYLSGLKMRGSSAAMVEIQVGDKREKLLAMEYAGMALAVRLVAQDHAEIVRLNVPEVVFDRYRAKGVQVFSNYGDTLDTPWKKLEQFQFKG
jgi:hypothetical protein